MKDEIARDLAATAHRRLDTAAQKLQDVEADYRAPLDALRALAARVAALEARCGPSEALGAPETAFTP